MNKRIPTLLAPWVKQMVSKKATARKNGSWHEYVTLRVGSAADMNELFDLVTLLRRNRLPAGS